MRFAWKVFAGMVVVVAVTTLILERITTRLVLERSREQAEQRLHEDLAVLVDRGAALLVRRDEPALQELADRVAEMLPGRRVTVVAPDGVVLADSHEDPAVMDDHSVRTEIREPGRIVDRHSRTLKTDLLYLAQLVVSDGQRAGYLRVAIESSRPKADIASLRRSILMGAALALGVGLVLAWVFARGVSRPLSRIQRFVDALGRGEYHQRLIEPSSDELGGLVREMNVMAGRLQRREERIVAEVSQKDAILRGLEEGVLAVDAEERLVLINAAARSILGVTEERLVGRRLSEVTRVREILESVGRSLGNEGRVRAELSVAAPASERIVQLIAAPVHDADGAVAMSVVVLHDLTDVRRLELARRDLVANVSHELKTPLTSMRGYIEAVLEDEDMPDEQRVAFLRKAQHNTDRLVAVVSDLLDLAKIEARKGDLQLEQVDLATVLADCVRQASAAADARRVVVRITGALQPCPVRGDERELATAVSNLLDNAIKYSPGGSVVDARVAPEGERIVLEVEDRGPGIPGHEQERIFERFYRVDRDRSRKLGGTGLGLSIVKNVVQAHAGEVSVRSTVGRGSTFRLALPREGAGGGRPAA